MLAIRGQIASALDLVVQTERMRDGVRRVTEVVEVVGMEGDVITLTELFTFRFTRESADGHLEGAFVSRAVRPRFLHRLDYYGLGEAFMKALQDGAAPQ
jgi:pilus assembly protein CpaF